MKTLIINMVMEIFSDLYLIALFLSAIIWIYCLTKPTYRDDCSEIQQSKGKVNNRRKKIKEIELGSNKDNNETD